MVDNLRAPVFVPFKHITNVNTVLIVQPFFFLQIRLILVMQLSYRHIIQFVRDDNILTITNCIFDGRYGIVSTHHTILNYENFLTWQSPGL